MRWCRRKLGYVLLPCLGVIVAALLVNSSWPRAAHATALIVESEPTVAGTANGSRRTLPRRRPRQWGNDALEPTPRQIDIDIKLKNLMSPVRSTPLLMPGSTSTADPRMEVKEIPDSQQTLNTGRAENRPATARSGRRGSATRRVTAAGPTIRDTLRAYINVRNPPGGSGAVGASGVAAGAPISLPVEFDRSWADLSVGSINQHGILDISADSILGELIFAVFEPTIEFGGDVTFSIVGLGRFMAETSSDRGSFRVVDLSAGYSVIAMSQGISSTANSTRREPGRKIKISITGFILSMLGEFIRTPMFYVMLLVTLLIGIYAWQRAKLTDVG